MATPKRTVLGPTSVRNAAVNMIQKTARNQDTIRRDVPCVAKITPRIIRDALSTETLWRQEAIKLGSITFTISTQPPILTHNGQLPFPQ